MVTVHVEPDGETLTFKRLNTVLQLLNKLELRPTQALVIRGNDLLTQDLPIGRDDEITVRKVISTG